MWGVTRFFWCGFVFELFWMALLICPLICFCRYPNLSEVHVVVKGVEVLLWKEHVFLGSN